MDKQYSSLEIGMLAYVFEKKIKTIIKWIEFKNDLLTSQKAIEALQKIETFRRSLNGKCSCGAMAKGDDCAGSTGCDHLKSRHPLNKGEN